MSTLSLPMVEAIANGIIYSAKTVEIPEELCSAIFQQASDALLQSVLPPQLRLPGFRNPVSAPRTLLFRMLRTNSPAVLTPVLANVCKQAISAVHEFKVKQGASALISLVQEHGKSHMHYALLVDRRKAVRNMAAWLALMPDPPNPQPEAPAAKASAGNIGKPPDADSYTPGPTHAAHLQRQLSQLQKDLQRREVEIAKLKQEKGERDRIIGQLRLDQQKQAAELTRLQAKAELSADQTAELEQLQKQRTALAARAAEIDKREHALESIYGDGAAFLKGRVLELTKQVHDLESSLTGLTLLLNKQTQQRHDSLQELLQTTTVSISDCVTAVQSHLEERVQAQTQAAGDKNTPAPTRLAAMEAAKELLQTKLALEVLASEQKQIPLAELQGNNSLEMAAQLLGGGATEETITGQVRYEGPSAWLVNEKHVVGLPTHLVDAEKLTTGDMVQLHLYHDNCALLDASLQVIKKVEEQLVNDFLRVDEGELYVLTPAGKQVCISLPEFIRSGVEIGAPVQVVAPRNLHAAAPSPAIPVYGRIAKELCPEVYRPPLLPVKGRRDTRQICETNLVPLPPLLAGRRVLLVGGDSYVQSYREVIEAMGGSFDWQSGFGQIARIPGKVQNNNLVIVVTGCVFHAVSDLAITEAKRASKLYCFFNSLGKASFIRFLHNLFGNQTASLAG